MPARRPPHQRLSPLAQHLADAGARARLAEQAAPPPDRIHRWLASLVLLSGVPFEYLVPDQAMLPPESIRFFYVDQNWVERLVDGALSTAPRTALDQVINDVLRGPIRTTVNDGKVSLVRQQLLGRAEQTPEVLASRITGFAIRSVVAEHWSGIVVENTDRADPSRSLTTLRLDRPASGVMFGLYNGELGSVTFKHAPETLHFGVDGQQGANAWTQQMRQLDAGRETGTFYAGAGRSADVHLRGDPQLGVIDVAATAAAFSTATGAKVTAAEYAVEMIESPEAVTFEWIGGTS